LKALLAFRETSGAGIRFRIVQVEQIEQDPAQLRNRSDKAIPGFIVGGFAVRLPIAISEFMAI